MYNDKDAAVGGIISPLTSQAGYPKTCSYLAAETLKPIMYKSKLVISSACLWTRKQRWRRLVILCSQPENAGRSPLFLYIMCTKTQWDQRKQVPKSPKKQNVPKVPKGTKKSQKSLAPKKVPLCNITIVSKPLQRERKEPQ